MMFLMTPKVGLLFPLLFPPQPPPPPEHWLTQTVLQLFCGTFLQLCVGCWLHCCSVTVEHCCSDLKVGQW